MKIHKPRTYLRMAKWRFMPEAKEKSRFNGFTFYHTLDTMPYPESFVKDVAPREMFDLVSNRHGRIAIDAGACIGFYTLHFARNFDRVWAFEPHPTSGEMLSKNVIRNHFAEKTVMQAVALSSENGFAQLNVRDNYKAASSLIPNHLFHTRTIQVQTRTLDSYMLRGVDLLKIDVEGMEVPVLEGAEDTIAENHPFLAVEVHRAITGNPCHCPCCQKIREFGYTIEDMRVHNVTKEDQIHWIVAE